MKLIPLQPVPSQVLTIYLSATIISKVYVYQKAYGLYCDVFQNDVPIVYGVLCENLNRIIRDEYLGFTGDLAFVDQHGTSDPDYTGLGSRFLLYYLDTTDLLAISPSASI